MKTWEQLTEAQQAFAVNRELDEVLRSLVEDQIVPDFLEERVLAAAEAADQMRTPWFICEYIMKTCADDLRAIALLNCQSAIYTSRYEMTMPEPEIK